MNNIAINALGKELKQACAYCLQQNIGLEITDFAFLNILDSSLDQSIDCIKTHSKGIVPIISHGPFMDLATSSRDPKIIQVCKERHQTALQASCQSGATVYIAHTNYNPLIFNASYRKGFAERMREFWLPLADWAQEKGMVIALENLWESEPEIQAELIDYIHHPALKASFDNGHALVYSKIPSSKWIQTLGNHMVHCHLHDNHGETDEHAVIGIGIEDWSSLINAIHQYSPKAIMVVENDWLEKNQQSYEKLKEYVSFLTNK